MSTTQDILKDKIGKTMSVLKTELNTVRAGRANAALLDQIVVPYWGVDTPLKQLANISFILKFALFLFKRPFHYQRSVHTYTIFFKKERKTKEHTHTCI